MKERASIAIMSLLLISAITLLAAITVAENNWNTSQQSLNRFIQESLYYAAEACLEESAIRIESDSSFSGAQLTIADNVICNSSVTELDGSYTVSIQVSENNYSENYQGIFDSQNLGSSLNLNLNTWTEL